MSVFIFILFSPVIAHHATASLQLDEIFFFSLLKYTLTEVLPVWYGAGLFSEMGQ